MNDTTAVRILPLKVNTVIEVTTQDDDGNNEIEKFVRVADTWDESHWLSLSDHTLWSLLDDSQWRLVSVPIDDVEVPAFLPVNEFGENDLVQLETQAKQLLAMIESLRAGVQE